MPKGIPNKRYTPEFKQLVVETMREEHLSVREGLKSITMASLNAGSGSISKKGQKDWR